MLASKLFEEKWIWQDADAKDITIDSRSVENGSIFVCIRGTNVDGHNFAKMAEEKGACCVIAEEELDLNIPCIVYPDTKIALAEIASKFYGKPEEKLHLVERFSRIKEKIEQIECRTNQNEIKELASKILEEL